MGFDVTPEARKHVQIAVLNTSKQQQQEQQQAIRKQAAKVWHRSCGSIRITACDSAMEHRHTHT